MKASLRPTVAALLLLIPGAAFLAAPAVAQQRVTVAPSIQGITLNADRGLAPGSTLQISVRAASRALEAEVRLGDSGIAIPLREVAPGTYRGSYTVRQSDRIDASGMLTVHLNAGAQRVSRNFSYPESFQAQAPGRGETPRIERFVIRNAERLEPGREIRFRMIGTPGGDAWLDIPGVAARVNLAETRPGVYVGEYTIRRRDSAAAFQDARATLALGRQRAIARADQGREPAAPRDEQPPSISKLTPSNGERMGERGRVHISAALADEGSGVDTDSVRLRVDGQDVTRDARVTADEVNFREDLRPGRHAVEVSVKDRAGNTTTKSWAFDVIDRDRDRDRMGSGPLPLRVTSPDNGAVVDANGSLQVEGRTVPGANVRVQVEAVSAVGSALGLTQQVADQTVEADREGRFQLALRPRSLPLPGTRYEVRITVTNGNQTAEERITVHQRQS
jgi:hypothetical protein